MNELDIKNNKHISCLEDLQVGTNISVYIDVDRDFLGDCSCAGLYLGLSDDKKWLIIKLPKNKKTTLININHIVCIDA